MARRRLARKAPAPGPAIKDAEALRPVNNVDLAPLTQEELDVFDASLSKFTGVNHLGLSIALLEETKRLQLTKRSTDYERKIVYENTDAMMLSFAPRDISEALLVTQMIATNHAYKKYMQEAIDINFSALYRHKSLELAMKLLDLHRRQFETLSKNRGRGQQKITVEHINIESGAQAIVGCVNTAPLDSKLDENGPQHLEPAPASISNTKVPHVSAKKKRKSESLD